MPNWLTVSAFFAGIMTKLGAYDYLVKPISKEDLILSLSRALERKRLVDILDISKKGEVPRLNKPEAFVTKNAPCSAMAPFTLSQT